MKQFLYITCLLFSFYGISQNNALFDQGKQQYRAEKYQEAITTWTKIIDAGEQSAAVYFNLANAYYKQNNIGPSIYYYEKALQLSPNDSEILNNIAFAKNAKIDAIDPLPKTFFAKWDENLSKWLTYEGWAILSICMAFLFVLLFLGYYFLGHSTKKRILFVGSILSLLILFTSVTMAFRTHDKAVNDRPAIIFAEETEVKSDPKMNSDTSFLLHEGTKVQILAEEGDWNRISIEDGKDGWMPAADLKEL
jgi:tetratricopeptide (TPR) repeat protein